MLALGNSTKGPSGLRPGDVQKNCVLLIGFIVDGFEAYMPLEPYIDAKQRRVSLAGLTNHAKAGLPVKFSRTIQSTSIF